MNGTNDGTGIFYEELWGTRRLHRRNQRLLRQRFDVVDSSNLSLYGGATSAAWSCREPGLYMIELKGMLDNATPSGTSNTLVASLHKLGTVSNNTYTGDTILEDVQHH